MIDQIPGVNGLAKLFLSTALASQEITNHSGLSSHQGISSACHSPQLSCHNNTQVDNLCCFNAPGGTLLLTQFWDAHPTTGPVDSWTLHDNCDGSYEAYCSDERQYSNISGILSSTSSTTLEYMHKFWKDYKGDDEHFWQHEWNKHGTCVSTLEPTCFEDYETADEVTPFFERAVSLFQGLPTYEWLADAGILPSDSTRYTFSDIHEALSSRFEGHEVRLGCRYGVLNEVWYFYNVRGSLQSGKFVPTDVVGSRSTCPQSGIKYLPKDDGTRPTATTTGRSTPTSRPRPGAPFVGRGQLIVQINGNDRGCIISRGDWYTSGTCATFRTSKSGDKFTITSSKGSCGFKAGMLTCGRGVKAADFESLDTSLSFGNSTSFSADDMPSGRRKSTVFAGSDHDVSFEIVWR